MKFPAPVHVWDEMTNPHRNWGLDVWRAVAILLVIRVHSLRLWETARPDWAFSPWLDGVNLFFVLSGFLIGGQLLKKGSTWSVLTFYKRRWYRTLPNYYLFFGIHVAYYFLLGVQDLIRWEPLFFLQNLVSGKSLFFGESWSLAVEEWFYLLLPLALWPLRSSKVSKVLWVGIVLAVAMAIKFGVYSQLDEALAKGSRTAVLARMDTLLLGVWMAAWVQAFPRIANVRHLLAVVGLTLGLGWYLTRDALLGMAFHLLDPFMESLAIVLFIPWVMHWKNPFGRAGLAFTWVSLMAYGLYLLNLPLFDVLLRTLTSLQLTGSLALALYGLVLGVMGVLAHQLYARFERPLTNLRDAS